jgi:UDP-N-acetylglucosamine 3-dehydrogenase
MPNLRAALVGLGIMGANHARVLSNLNGVDLVGVSDPQGDIHGVLRDQKVVNTVREVIDLNVDYCVIAAPTAFHEEIALELIQSGIHVLIEKPIAQTPEAAKRISAAASEKNLVCAVGHIERFNAALQQAKKRISNGDLGEVYQISTRRIGPFPSRISDVGVVMDLATHDIDLTMWISNKNYVSVSAHTVSRSGRKHEDMVAVTGMLEEGIVINHLVNWLSPLKERKTIFTGEKGTFVADTLTSDLTFYANGTFDVAQEHLAHFKGVTQGNIHVYAFDKPEPLRLEHENFRDAILGKSGDIVTLEEGSRTVQIASAILESAQNRKEVAL